MAAERLLFVWKGEFSVEYNPYTALANAIIEQAVDDYRSPKFSYERGFIKKFFLSEWFTMLTDLDGKMIVRRLEEERGAKNVKGYRKNY